MCPHQVGHYGRIGDIGPQRAAQDTQAHLVDNRMDRDYQIGRFGTEHPARGAANDGRDDAGNGLGGPPFTIGAPQRFPKPKTVADQPRVGIRYLIEGPGCMAPPGLHNARGDRVPVQVRYGFGNSLC